MVVANVVKMTLETIMLESKDKDFHLNPLLSGEIHLVGLMGPDRSIIDSLNLTEIGQRPFLMN